MAQQKYLEELSVEQLIAKYNFVIPEIQREYVWGTNDQFILDKFFLDIKEALTEENKSESAGTELKVLQDMLSRAEERDKENITKLIDTYVSRRDLNIGFLYSYRPDYYVYNDRNEDVYLIDGQQRFTTLFLALFYFSLREPETLDDFKNLFRFDFNLEKIAFDYRVRSLTHNFLFELINRCRTINDIVSIRDKTWFLNDFSKDVTVNAMIETFEKLNSYYKTDTGNYYTFIKKQIRFWHFKTEETSQGEELYITMNSRGQQLADNETIRASLFEHESIKSRQTEWGAKWEIWQDFFWKNRKKGGNADNGLNNFLRWVNIIEYFSNNNSKSREEREAKYKELYTDTKIIEGITLFVIEPYFNALKVFKEYFDNSLFKDGLFKEHFREEWLYGDISQVNLIKLLPALMFLKKHGPKEQLNRFLRFFVNATNDIDIAKSPDNFIIESIQLTKKLLDSYSYDVSDFILYKDGFPRLLNSEEICKLSLFKTAANEQVRTNLESAFWEAEDFKFSKGKIGHLLQMSIYDGDVDSFVFQKSLNYETIKYVDLQKFKEIYSVYSEMINNENEIWGDLLITPIYVEENDRVYAQGSWHINNSYLRFVFCRLKRNDEDLIDFLYENEKKFILEYANSYEIQQEEDSKKQLYIYYILHKRILNKWNWNKWNFGIYDGEYYPNVFTLFANKQVYQFYNVQWRYNVGYELFSGPWLQDNHKEKRDYISELIDWANS